MGNRLKLEEEEQKIYDELTDLVGEIQQWYMAGNRENKTRKEILEKQRIMAEKAHELHMLLKDRQLEPKHHKYMYENRGVSADTVEFYNHLHPVEDLISFINDPDSNNDPEDTTINKVFDFRIYTRRWGHYDNYQLKRTRDGWTITGLSGEQKANKEGTPGVIWYLKHDLVSYPYNIGDLLQRIWDKAAEGLDEGQVQIAIDDLAEWISLCEKSTPGGIFEE